MDGSVSSGSNHRCGGVALIGMYRLKAVCLRIVRYLHDSIATNEFDRQAKTKSKNGTILFKLHNFQKIFSVAEYEENKIIAWSFFMDLKL